MTKTGPNKVNLAEYKERKTTEGAVDIEADGGKVFRVPPPELWPDGLGTLRGDLVAQAEAIMGAEQFAQFKEAGGSANLLDAIIRDNLGTSAGK